MDISQSYKTLRDIILKEKSDMSVMPKSVVSDTFLVPNATEITKLKVLISFVSGMQSFAAIKSMLSDLNFLDTVAEALEIAIEDVLAIISGALDQLASNYNRTRKAPVTATGMVSFYRPNPLTDAEFASGVVTAGNEVYTSTGVIYRITSDVPYNIAYYDPDFNAYMLDVPVIAQVPGTVGNAPEFTIINLRSAVSGFGNVTNKLPITNGLNVEQDVAFADRLQTEISGNNWGTPNGIKNAILQEFENLSDLIVVGAGDAIMHRDNNWGGRPDVYILEKNWQLNSITVVYNGEMITYIDGLVPVSAAHPVTASSGSFVFYPDSSTLEAGSARSKDFLLWTVRPTGPYPRNVTISYFYDKNITDVQAYVEQDDRNTGADILIRQSTEIPVDIFFELIILAGYNLATVTDEIRVVLTDFVNSRRLGESVEQSDIINQIYTVEGVDRVVLPMSKFNVSTGTGSVDRILTEKNQYVRLHSLNIG